MKTLTQSNRFTAALATLTLGLVLISAAAADSTRAAIAAQSSAFMDAMERGDARAVAELFTTDAKLIVSGIDDVVAGRAAIEKFWQVGFSNGVKGLRLTALDLDGTGPLRVETGTYQALGAGGSELGRGHYMFVWKKEGGAWKIHRDIGSAKPMRASAAAGAGSGTMDRVGFPRDYRADLKLLSVSARDAEPSVMTAYGNALAASGMASGSVAYPYGTVFAMEFAHGVRDGETRLMRDESGTPLKADVARVDVMRRERGYGEAYGENRAGEWEFASYRPDGTTLIAPEDAGACAACHRKAGAERDFVYGLRVPAK
jgi:uncharacterized protein (TIGR02246 family)